MTKKKYQKPKMRIYSLIKQTPLLAGSGGGSSCSGRGLFLAAVPSGFGGIAQRRRAVPLR